MTAVTIFIEAENGSKRITGFTVEGHSDFAEKGEDIVCAGISALTQGAIVGLQRYLGLEPEVEVREKEGWLSCRLPLNLNDQTRLQSEAILQTMFLGLADLAASYPGFLKVQQRRCS